MKLRPETQAVIDAFLDVDAPEGLRAHRRNELKEFRPKLFTALEELVKSVQP